MRLWIRSSRESKSTILYFVDLKGKSRSQERLFLMHRITRESLVSNKMDHLSNTLFFESNQGFCIMKETYNKGVLFMPEQYKLITSNYTKLDLAVFHHPQPKGVLQIVHGALEYKERYFHFAEFLNQQGYAVILSDNRGHGESTSEADPFGVMHSFEQLVEDQVSITAFMKGKYPNVPYFLYGHSFGSIIARAYLQAHDDELEKLLLTGTANYVPVVPLAVKIGGLYLKIKGPHSKNKLLNQLSGNLGVEHDWLSNNPESNEQAKNDPQMVPDYPVSSLQTIWVGDHQLKAYDRFQVKNPDLPILSLVGAEDVKITGGKKGLADTVKTLKKIGYRNVTSEEMPGMKHEVLNEIDNAKVYQRILAFLDGDM